jgi:cellulose biosynthesis protein BcsQ
MVLGFKGADELEDFYQSQGQNTLRSGLVPAFEAQPKSITAVKTVEVVKRPGLHLLAGDLRLSEYEVTLGIAQELSAAIGALQNLPGSLTFLIEETAKSIGADFILLDMSPGLGPINQNLVITSDYLILPTSPDVFSVMAIDSLARILPRWKKWADQASSIPVLQQAAYPYPPPSLKVLGTVVQKFRPRSGRPASAFQKWINEVGEAVTTRLRPALSVANMMLPQSTYDEVGVSDDLMLAEIADFNSLISRSQEFLTPIFELTEAQLKSGGAVLENTIASRNSFYHDFTRLADRIVRMTKQEGQ